MKLEEINALREAALVKKDLDIESARAQYEEAVKQYHRKVHAVVQAFEAESKRLEDESKAL